MKRFLTILTLAFFAIGLVGCNNVETTTETPTTEFTAPATMVMGDVDDYLFNENFQFVDVRNFDDQMSGGWVRGFEIIPFFDYLEYENILVRQDGWTFSAAAIKDANALKALFDKDKAIVLMCAGGTRAGFVKDALDSLGYENVYNVGGLSAYNGENRVLGDDKYEIYMPTQAEVGPLPETIDMSDELIDVYAARKDVQFVDLRNMEDILTMVDGETTLSNWHKGATVIPFFNFLETSNILVRNEVEGVKNWTFTADTIKDEAALRALFCEDKNIILFCKSGGRAGFVKSALEELGYTNVWNAGGFSDYAGAADGTGGGCE